MKRKSSLIRLNEYLSVFAVEDPRDGTVLKASMTTAQADATSKLAHRSGPQILAARPDERIDGNNDSYTSSLSTAIFVLAPCLEQKSTEEAENDLYDHLAEIAEAVSSRIREDATSGNCGLLTGMSVASVDIAPESSVFGGWCGYSVEISFE